MKNNFNKALEFTITKEFEWLDDFRNPYENYIFSDEFESRMVKIFNIPERSYVSIGTRRVRKSLVAMFIAALIFTTGCAAAYFIKWNTSQNNAQGTLDITFDIQGENPNAPTELSIPVTPDGWKISDKQKSENDLLTIEYTRNSNEMIYYVCSYGVNNASMSVNNENGKMTKTTINGFDAYHFHSYKDGYDAVYWTDGTWIYSITGTCNFSMLKKMATSLRPLSEL